MPDIATYAMLFAVAFGAATIAQLERAQLWYQRHGKWSLLLSWVPVVGDPLTVIAGVLREPLPVFLVLVTVAKVGRYLALTAIVIGGR